MLIQFVEGIAYLLFRLVFVKQFVCRFFVNYIWCFKFIIRVIFAVAENEYKCLTFTRFQCQINLV